jgi:hypothetical protein
MNFETLTRVMLSKMAVDEKFVSEVQTWPLFVDQWPNSQEKDLFREFLNNCESNSIKFAQWKFAQHPRFEFLRGFSSLDPDNPEILRQSLKVELQSARAQFTALEVLKAPDRAVELFRAYEAGLPIADDLLDISTAAASLFKKYHAKVMDRGICQRVAGWEMLSDAIGGFNPGRLALCMAQTGYGKTNLALNLAMSAQETMNTWYFNMEMGLEDIFERMMAIFYDKPFSDLRRYADVNIGPMLQFFRNFQEAPDHFWPGQDSKRNPKHVPLPRARRSSWSYLHRLRPEDLPDHEPGNS